MLLSKNTLVIVPARGGSKRVLNKNIRPICGRPMIGWPLSVLAGLFPSDSILLSTDSEEIKNVGRQFGATAPFTRPHHLAGDFAGTMEVATHALDWYERNVRTVGYVLIVYPTAVLLKPEDIDQAASLLESDDAASVVFSATEYAFPIQRAIYLNDANRVRAFQPEHYGTRSQDLPKALHDAGQFYFCRADTVRIGAPLFSECARIVELPRWRVVDIDTEDDFRLAEIMLGASLK